MEGIGGKWIGQSTLWDRQGASKQKQLSVAVPDLLPVPNRQPSPLPVVRTSRGKRKQGTDPVSRLRKGSSRKQQDHLEPLTISVEEDAIVIRSETLAARVKPRPRLAHSGHVYMPPEYMDWKKQVARPVALKLKKTPIYAQERITLEFWVWSGRGDVDNLAGGIMDALNGIVWFDDDQIVDLYVHKRKKTKTSAKWMAIIRIHEDVETY